ncbi:hypothetical protein ROZALSC1DRAFT_27866, partial [Rozella allomycis CSF55]
DSCALRSIFGAQKPTRYVVVTEDGSVRLLNQYYGQTIVIAMPLLRNSSIMDALYDYDNELIFAFMTNRDMIVYDTNVSPCRILGITNLEGTTSICGLDGKKNCDFLKELENRDEEEIKQYGFWNKKWNIVQQAHSAELTKIECHAETMRIFTAGNDIIKAHNADEDHNKEVTRISSHSILQLYVTSSIDGLVKLWDNDNTLIREIQFSEPVYSVCFANEKADLLVGLENSVALVRCFKYLPNQYLKAILKLAKLFGDLPIPVDKPKAFNPDFNYWEEDNIGNVKNESIQEDVVQRLIRLIEESDVDGESMMDPFRVALMRMKIKAKPKVAGRKSISVQMQNDSNSTEDSWLTRLIENEKEIDIKKLLEPSELAQYTYFSEKPDIEIERLGNELMIDSNKRKNVSLPNPIQLNNFKSSIANFLENFKQEEIKVHEKAEELPLMPKPIEVNYDLSHLDPLIENLENTLRLTSKQILNLQNTNEETKVDDKKSLIKYAKKQQKKKSIKRKLVLPDGIILPNSVIIKSANFEKNVESIQQNNVQLLKNTMEIFKGKAAEHRKLKMQKTDNFDWNAARMAIFDDDEEQNSNETLDKPKEQKEIIDRKLDHTEVNKKITSNIESINLTDLPSLLPVESTKLNEIPFSENSNETFEMKSVGDLIQGNPVIIDQPTNDVIVKKEKKVNSKKKNKSPSNYSKETKKQIETEHNKYIVPEVENVEKAVGNAISWDLLRRPFPHNVKEEEMPPEFKNVVNMTWFPGLNGKESTLVNIVEILLKLIAHGTWSEKVEASKSLVYLYETFKEEFPNPLESLVLPQIDSFNDDAWQMRAQTCLNMMKYNIPHDEVLIGLIGRLGDKIDTVKTNAKAALAHFGIETKDSLLKCLEKLGLIRINNDQHQLKDQKVMKDTKSVTIRPSQAEKHREKDVEGDGNLNSWVASYRRLNAISPFKAETRINPKRIKKVKSGQKKSNLPGLNKSKSYITASSEYVTIEDTNSEADSAVYSLGSNSGSLYLDAKERRYLRKVTWNKISEKLPLYY